jgi:hypothetical protein
MTWLAWERGERGDRGETPADSPTAGVEGVGGQGRGYETLEELDLVEGSLRVSGCGLDDLEGDVAVEPGGGM